ncbi:Flagellar M-ring protein [Sodalis praecaptivus]|uniref:Flagellar M-ring protein n=1 Tax=Sodalis praecaptivus TaxID=1239307 RepID=W0HPG4_9GAMM|nr:flagellar basal-body MS-ring/collar protein FliF [Sodalis praecaptivus]AHF75751.1 Flagellar M-ring protein [Sodalis praecaptivus]
MSTVKNGSATQGKNPFAPYLERLRVHPKLTAAVAVAAAIALVVALALWAKSPDYRVLYSNLSDRDGGDIVTQLTQMNIPYRFSEQGTALLIPADKVHETRLKLAGQGLPKGGAVGFELLDQEKFGISQFSEQINYQRGLEGELARTMETLGPVVSARVHLALPKPSLFIREQKNPSASVTLTLQPGRVLDDGQVSAIVYMVASSVAGMPPANVTVLDQQGHLLTQADPNGRELNATQLKFSNELENNFQRRIENILAPVVGSGNVHAQVTAQIDFDSQEQTEERYGPNGSGDSAAIRSRQASESEQLGGGAQGGVPGALSNQPAPANSAPIDKTPANRTPARTAARPAPNANANANANATSGRAPTQSSNTRKDETVNYELDRTLRHVRRNVGQLQRLSVAVVVNYQGTSDDATGKPLPPETLRQIEAITREAMGYSSERGDTLSVINTPFMQSGDGEPALPFWQQPLLLNALLSAGRWLVVLLAAWWLWRKVVKPLVASKTAAPQAAATATTVQAAAAAEEDVVVKLSKEQQEAQQRAAQRDHTEARAERVRTLADSDPRIVALVVRQWIANEI